MKHIVFGCVSVVFAIAAVAAVICAVTVTGSGSLDLSNIARWVFVGLASVLGCLAVVAWKKYKKGV